MTRLLSLLSPLSLLCLLLLSAPTFAQSAAQYPNKRITIIVPFTAGGPADGVTRFVAERMNKDWGQPVIVENRVGAGGIIGADAVAKAAPDGYTLGLLVTAHTILPSLQKSIPYDITKDFAPITIINRAPKLVLVHPSVPAADFAQLIALAKSSPDKYASYATSGVGSMANLSMELVNSLAGTKFVHIPYKGGSAAQVDLLSGQLLIGVLDMGSVLPFVKDGRLKVLAVTSKTRSPILPNVPTIAEALPGFEAEEWFGLVAPKGTPPDIVQKIADATRRALTSPEAKAKYVDQLGWELVASTPDEMSASINSQVKKWGDLTQQLGIQKQ
jgi:tripartite-type tricarboxylate transporter receptor subunit TctC